MTLTRDEILAKRSAAVRESLEVPELGGSVFIKVLMLREVADFQRTQKASSDLAILYPKIISIGCVGEDGNPLFVGEDIKLLAELPWPATDAIATAILKLNKMAGEAEANGQPPAPKGSSPTNGFATDLQHSSTGA